MNPDLISRLETAAEGSRELSDEVLLALGWSDNDDEIEGYWIPPEGGRWGDRGERPDPTRSIDDALGLMLDGWWVHHIHEARDIETWRANYRFNAKICPPKNLTSPAFPSNGSTIPLAVCAALLRAKEAES